MIASMIEVDVIDERKGRKEGGEERRVDSQDWVLR
jgi:hypothetical protein